jgi:N-acetylglutamate synthase-like GNAT family acetyltransferase
MSVYSNCTESDLIKQGGSNMEWHKDNYLIGYGFERMDTDAVYELLSKSYWASERPKDVIVQSMHNSVCFGLFESGKQIGFARVITDNVVFAWICDVIIDSNFRGNGLGKWLLSCILEHLDLQVKTIGLFTKDAHTFYEQYNFKAVDLMQRVINDPKSWENSSLITSL